MVVKTGKVIDELNKELAKKGYRPFEEWTFDYYHIKDAVRGNLLHLILALMKIYEEGI